MTHALRHTVQDMIKEIHPNNYSTLVAATNHLTDKALGELLDLLRELEARTNAEKMKRYVRY